MTIIQTLQRKFACLSAFASVALVAALLAAGCGGGGGTGASGNDGSGTSSADSTTQSGSNSGKQGDGNSASATFIKEADAICAKIPENYAANLKKLPKAQQKNPAISVPKAAVPPMQAAHGELEALPVPAGDEQQVEAMLDAFVGAIESFEKNPKQPLGGPKTPFEDFNKLAKAYGLKVCSAL